MGAYTVLATRYRPRAFEDVVGQEDTARVLSSSIANDRAGHAFLFSGPRGVGKTSMARILAKAFDCLERDDGVPCGSCRVCTAIDEAGQCLDVVEIDGASHNKVENVRDLIENLRFRPVEARYRIYVIDEVHMLSTAAFNALLKTLEEPPAHAKFILATTEPLKVPETIRSRCQVFDFRRLTAEQIAGRLAYICEAEGVSVPETLLPRLARQAQGGLRDALSLLDQLITYGEGAPTLADFERLTGRLSPALLADLVGAALAGDTSGAHAGCETALGKGARPADLIDQLTELLEGVLVSAAGGQPADRTPEECAALAELAQAADVDRLLAMLDVLVEAARRLRQRADGRLVAEMTVLNLARVHALRPLADLLASGGSGGAGGAPPARSPAPQRRAQPSQRQDGPSGGSPPPPSARAPAPRSRPEPTPSAPPPATASTGGTATAQERAPEPTPEPPPPSVPTSASAPASDPPPPYVPGSSAAPAAEAAPEPAPDDFRSQFLATLTQRSLRMELEHYPAIELEGEVVHLTQPAGGHVGIHDPVLPAVREQLQIAGRALTGKSLTFQVRANSSGAVAPAPSAAAAPKTPPAAKRRKSPEGVERQVRSLWPDADSLDA
jgi:DNA polymerase-3 subunit gamma/tau